VVLTQPRLRGVPVSWDTSQTKAARTAMNENSASEPLQRQLAYLQPQWLSWLRLRHRSLAPLHEEITQAAAADLVEYVSRRPLAAVSDEELRKIGFTILRRRVADQYRSKVLIWADESALHDLESPDPSTNPEQVATYSRLLRTVLALLARLGPDSRELLLRETPLTDAERQRRSRLRADLRRQLLDQFGIDLKQVL
jgi:DNA-directed RNA polymerase specialized sigma24 family protein